jgi:hypothetical protein
MSRHDESIVSFAKRGFFFLSNLIFFLGFALTAVVYHFAGNEQMTMIWGAVACVSGFRLFCKLIGADDV